MGDGWQAAPDAVVRHKASTTVTMRMPIDMLAVLKGFAEPPWRELSPGSAGSQLIRPWTRSL